MGVRLRKKWDLPSEQRAALAVLGTLFLLGGGAGCLFAALSDGEGAEELSGYLSGYLELAGGVHIEKQLHRYGEARGRNGDGNNGNAQLLMEVPLQLQGGLEIGADLHAGILDPVGDFQEFFILHIGAHRQGVDGDVAGDLDRKSVV